MEHLAPQLGVPFFVRLVWLSKTNRKMGTWAAEPTKWRVQNTRQFCPKYTTQSGTDPYITWCCSLHAANLSKIHDTKCHQPIWYKALKPICGNKSGLSKIHDN